MGALSECLRCRAVHLSLVRALIFGTVAEAGAILILPFFFLIISIVALILPALPEIRAWYRGETTLQG